MLEKDHISSAARGLQVLEALLDTKPADRAKQLKTWTDQKLAAADAKAMCKVLQSSYVTAAASMSIEMD